MWVRVEDSRKQRAKANLIDSIQQIRSNTAPLQGEINSLISALDAAVSGMPSGMDVRMIGDCQLALKNVSAALSYLASAQSSAKALDTTTMEWVDIY